MRISELSTEELAPILTELAVPVSDIAMDEATVQTLRTIAEKKTEIEQLGAFVREIFPLLLKTHFDSTCSIIAILTGKTVEQVKKQKGLQTIADAVNIVDADLMDFFKQFVHTEQRK